ncbi:MAG: ATP-binding protein [Thermodesulfobacteriota bacterium]
MSHGDPERRASIAIDSALHNIALVGLAVKGICTQLPFDEKTAFQLELCVVEAVTNVVKHAYQGQAGQEVAVSLAVGTDRLVITITDHGRPGLCLDAPRRAVEPAGLDAAPEGGVGLVIINTVMDSVEYSSEEGRNVLRLVKWFSHGGGGESGQGDGLAG